MIADMRAGWRDARMAWWEGWPVALPLLALGALITGLAGALGSYGGWWWLVAVPALAIGILLLMLGSLGFFTPWLWLKVDVRSPDAPRIRFGLPVPVRQLGWAARLAGRRAQGLEPLIVALGKGGTPFEIEVDDTEAGEHVAVSLRRLGEKRMTTSEERVKILKMVEEGKLTAEEAVGLLSALGKVERKRPPSTDVDSRWLRVRVTDMATGKPKVNVNIPMRLVNVGLRVGARFIPDMEGVELTDLSQALEEGMTGKIIDVIDEEDNERVEIFAE